MTSFSSAGMAVRIVRARLYSDAPPICVKSPQWSRTSTFGMGPRNGHEDSLYLKSCVSEITIQQISNVFVKYQEGPPNSMARLRLERYNVFSYFMHVSPAAASLETQSREKCKSSQHPVGHYGPVNNTTNQWLFCMKFCMEIKRTHKSRGNCLGRHIDVDARTAATCEAGLIEVVRRVWW